MNKLIKYLSLTGIFSSAILVATVPIVSQTTNHHLTLADQEWQGNLKEKAAFWLIKQFTEMKETDGSMIKVGEKAGNVTDKLWETIKEAKIEARVETNHIPIIGRTIANLIKNIKFSDLGLKNNHQILNQGDNWIAVTLKIGKVKYDDLTMKIINVQAAK